MALSLAGLGGFFGFVQEVLIGLNQQEGVHEPKNRPEDWAFSAEALGRRLKRLQTALETGGLVVRQRRGKERIWSIAETRRKKGGRDAYDFTASP